MIEKYMWIKNAKQNICATEVKNSIKHIYETTNITMIYKKRVTKYHRNINIILTI
jgi:hypothetical protein